MRREPGFARTSRWRTLFFWMMAGAALGWALWLGAGQLLGPTPVYPDARRLSDSGLRLHVDCPTYGSRIGSVRSPLCSLGVRREALFETDAPMSQVARWLAGRQGSWATSIGRLAIRVVIARAEPAPPANARTRFRVESGIYVEVRPR